MPRIQRIPNPTRSPSIAPFTTGADERREKGLIRAQRDRNAQEAHHRDVLNEIGLQHPSMVSTYLTWCYTRVLPARNPPDGHPKVELILQDNLVTGSRNKEYLIKWEGYDIRYTSWVSDKNEGLEPEFIKLCRRMRESVEVLKWDFTLWTGRPKVFANLVGFLAKEFDLARLGAGYGGTHITELRQLIQEMVEHDNVTSLVKCTDFRVKLLKFEHLVRNENRKAMWAAITADEVQICDLLQHIVSNEKLSVMSLRGEAADNFISFVPEVMSSKPWIAKYRKTETQKDAYQRVIKLSIACGVIPQDLLLDKVENRTQHHTAAGAFGQVYLAQYRDCEVGLKRLKPGVPKNAAKNQREFCAEVLMWRELKHEFVLPILGVYSESSVLYMVTPWMPFGTIRDYLRTYEGIDPRGFILEIAEGVEYLQSRDVTHGDLRSANILVNDDRHVQIADFGLCGFADSTRNDETKQRGNVRWMAPELLSYQAMKFPYFRRTFETDIYSFAMVCVELYTTESPFHDVADIDLVSVVLSGRRPPYTKNIDSHLWGVMNWCWHQDAMLRPKIKEIIEELKGCSEKYANVPEGVVPYQMDTS